MYDLNELVRVSKIIGYRKMLKIIEQDIITRAMQISKGDCSRAARKLGMKRTTLVERRKALGIYQPKEVKTGE